MASAKRVYLWPSAVLLFALGAGALSLWWDDLVGVLLAAACLVSVAGLFRRARKASLDIGVEELLARERRRST